MGKNSLSFAKAQQLPQRGSLIASLVEGGEYERTAKASLVEGGGPRSGGRSRTLEGVLTIPTKSQTKTKKIKFFADFKKICVKMLTR